jgi:hypothetical protein
MAATSATSAVAASKFMLLAPSISDFIVLKRTRDFNCYGEYAK